MNTGATAVAVKSVLEKPLHELTEDDISQLTREDCRRYLKDKGMRRPSWNKSQAIQQVISLKSLLEPSLPKPLISPTTVTSNSSSSVKELSQAEPDGSGSGSGSAEDGGPCQPAGPSSLGAAGEVECRPAAIDAKAISVRSTDEPHLPVGQMTIFYSGKVNVYDGVPVDKQARTLMHLASSPIHFSQDEPRSGNSNHGSAQSQLTASSVKFNVDGSAVQSVIAGKITEPIRHCRSEGNILHEQDVEGQTNRQVLLQRYFEKRKDRGKFKMRRRIGSSSPGLEMYVNHQNRTHVTSGQTAPSNTGSQSQLGAPCIGYGLMDKQQKSLGLSVDLNDKATD